MELNTLISDIKKEGKLSSEEIVKFLADAVDNEEDKSCVYEDLYKKAFGSHLSEKLCRDWVSKMTQGEKWSIDQTTDVGQKNNISWSEMTKYEWYAALNGAYSDFHKVGSDYQVDEDADFYADLAKAFWMDDSDVHDKTICSYYFNYVA